MKPDSNIISNRKPYKKRWLRTLYILLGIIVPAVLLYHYLTTPERIRLLAVEYIQQHTQQTVSIEKADFSLFGGTHLYGVTIDDPFNGEKNESSPNKRTTLHPLFTCQELHLIHQPWSAMIGRLRINNVVAIQPTCTIIYDEKTGTTNLSKLFPLNQIPGSDKSVRLPMIELRDSRIIVFKQSGHDLQKIEDLRLMIRGRPSKHDANLYRIAWNDIGNDTSGGHSQIDLTTGLLRNAQGGLPSMNIEAVMLAVNAKFDGVGAWSTLLGLTGQVRASDYSLALNDTDGLMNWITLKLSDASLSVPIDQHDTTVPRHQRYVQIERVNGSATIHADSITASFTGLFHGSPCQVSTTIRSGTNTFATLDDINITATLKIQNMSLPSINDPATPEQTRFIYHWPQLARYYRIFDPQGYADIDLEIEINSGVDPPLIIHHAKFTAKNISGTYRTFPYEAHHVTGVVEFTPEGIFLRDLSGKHNDGEFVVNGKIDRPSVDSPATLTIHATGIPIDDSLYAVLPSKYRDMIDTFSPLGLIDMNAELIRPESTVEAPAHWQIKTAVSFKNLSALYKKFPYRFEQLSGIATLDQNIIQVSNVTGKMGDGRIHIDGQIDISSGRVKNLDLVITGEDIQIDDHLFAALPESLRKTTVAFRPSGKFDVVSSLVQPDDPSSAYRSYRFQFKGVQIHHRDLPIPYTNIAGDVTLTRDQFIVHQMSGQFHGGELSAEGSIAHAQSNSFTDFTLLGKNIRIDDEFMTALPKQWREPYSQWNVHGIADTTINLTKSGNANNQLLQIHSTVQLSNATVRHQNPDIDFQNLSASLTFKNGEILGTDIRADFLDAGITGSFEIQHTGESRSGNAKFTANGLTLNEELRKMIPDRLHNMWNQIRPAGKVDFSIDQLQFDSPANQQQTTWWVDGKTLLYDVSLGSSGSYKNLNGNVFAKGMLIDPLAGTVLNGSIDLNSITLSNHPISQVKSTWSLTHTQEGQGHLALHDIQGKLYDGDIAARLEVSFEPGDTNYDLSSTIQNMDIRPYIKTVKQSHMHYDNNNTQKTSSEIRGWVDAQIYLTGSVGDHNSRRGGGRVEIKNGYFYRLPIILSILHVLNLSIPEQNAFEEAMASFYIVDRHVQLDDILLRNHHLTLVGDGTMTLPDLGVDLNLVYINDNQLTRLPLISDIFVGASSQMMPLHVTGPLHSPTVRAMPFKALTDELKKLFKKKPTKKRKVIKP